MLRVREELRTGALRTPDLAQPHSETDGQACPVEGGRPPPVAVTPGSIGLNASKRGAAGGRGGGQVASKEQGPGLGELAGSIEEAGQEEGPGSTG